MCTVFGEGVGAWAGEVLARLVSRSTRKRGQLGGNASSMNDSRDRTSNIDENRLVVRPHLESGKASPL
jgi:hypothetical protein